MTSQASVFDGVQPVISELRKRFNEEFKPEKYTELLAVLDRVCETKVEFRVSETPIFVPASLLHRMAKEGEDLAQSLIGDAAYLESARQAIPQGYHVANETTHPHFLTADFALVRTPQGELTPKLVEIQAFPSVFGYQATLAAAYQRGVRPAKLDAHLFERTDRRKLLGSSETVRFSGGHDPENVVLTEVDPQHQKTLPDFNITARRLGIAVVDIASLQVIQNKLHYRNSAGRLVPIHRVYNRAIADELIARHIKLPFDLTGPMGRGMGGASELVFPHQQVFHSLAFALLGRPSRHAAGGSSRATFLQAPDAQSLQQREFPWRETWSEHGLQRSAAQAALLLCR